jgi:hypothetical protein
MAQETGKARSRAGAEATAAATGIRTVPEHRTTKRIRRGEPGSRVRPRATDERPRTPLVCDKHGDRPG